MQRFLQAERHISTTLKRMKKCHDFGLMPWFTSSRVCPDFAFGERICFGLQIDFGVNIGCIQQNVSQPSANSVESTPPRAGDRQSNVARCAGSYVFSHRGYLSLCFSRVAFDKRMDTKACDRLPATIDEYRFVRCALTDDRGQCLYRQRPQGTKTLLAAFAHRS